MDTSKTQRRFALLSGLWFSLAVIEQGWAAKNFYDHNVTRGVVDLVLSYVWLGVGTLYWHLSGKPQR